MGGTSFKKEDGGLKNDISCKLFVFANQLLVINLTKRRSHYELLVVCRGGPILGRISDIVINIVQFQRELQMTLRAVRDRILHLWLGLGVLTIQLMRTR